MTPKNFLTTVCSAALALVFPERCQLCRQGHASPAEGYVCSSCRLRVQPISGPSCSRCGLPFHGAITHEFQCPNCTRIPLAFSRARSAVEAVGPARHAIHLYKYHRALWLEPFLSDIWLPAALPDISASPWTGIVPVPLHPVRLREREFNQAERLARILAAPLSLPVQPDLVRQIGRAHV